MHLSFLHLSGIGYCEQEQGNVREDCERYQSETHAQKDEMMKTLTDNISKVLENKITEVDQVYDPACQKLSVQAEAITNYLEKVEKSLHRTSQVLKNSKLRELMTAEKMIDDDIQMLKNEKPQNLTSFQVQVDNPGSCVEKLCFYTTFMDLAGKCEYISITCKVVFLRA